MTNGWSIGPDIASLELRVVPGLPVTWPLTPLPDNWVPNEPVINILLPDNVIISFPLVYGSLGGEEVWYTTLTGEQTLNIESGEYVNLSDTNADIAAGRLTKLSRWRSNVTPVSMPARILAGPPGTGTGGGGYTQTQIEEFARDAVGAALTPGAGDDIIITPNDLANTITVSVAEIQSLALLYQSART